MNIRVALFLAALPAVPMAALAQDLPGTPILDTRLRYEFADEDSLDSASALTARVRAGWKLPSYHGFSALAEIEGTLAADNDAYDPYPGPEGPLNTTLIPDPENLELNRLHLNYEGHGATGILGRQRIILNNARFVGNVGWRQNEQTFDAALASYTHEDWTLGYTFIERANRIFGVWADNITQRRLDLETHALWVNGKLPQGVTAGAYALLLHVEDPAAMGMSSDTVGAFLERSWSIRDDQKLNVRAEYARQTENSSSPAAADYNLDYWHLNAAYTFAGIKLGLGWEHLEGDGSNGFSTPLATLHAFNGWADRFGSTPGTGLEDYYVSLSATAPYDIGLTAVWHWYEADSANFNYGQEWNLQATKKLAKNLTAMVKGAWYIGDDSAPAPLDHDVTKVIVQLEWSL